MRAKYYIQNVMFFLLLLGLGCEESVKKFIKAVQTSDPSAPAFAIFAVFCGIGIIIDVACFIKYIIVFIKSNNRKVVADKFKTIGYSTMITAVIAELCFKFVQFQSNIPSDTFDVATALLLMTFMAGALIVHYAQKYSY